MIYKPDTDRWDALVKSQEQTVKWLETPDKAHVGVVFNRLSFTRHLDFPAPTEILQNGQVTVVLLYKKEITFCLQCKSYFFVLVFYLAKIWEWFVQSDDHKQQQQNEPHVFIHVCEVAEKLQAAWCIWMCCCLTQECVCVCMGGY